MKTRAYRTWTLLMLWLGAAALMMSCGLGTEVGNGFKPKKDGDDEGTSASKMPSEGAQDDTISDAEVGGGDAADEEDQGAVAPSVDYLKINKSIPKALLFATCGSPLGDELELPFDLILSNDETLVWHVAAGDGAIVTLRGENADDYWDLDRTVPEAIAIKDENGVEFTDVYKCQSAVDRKVTKQDDDTFVEASSVSIDHDGSSYAISWAISYASETGPRRLKTVSISAPDGQVVELEARY